MEETKGTKLTAAVALMAVFSLAICFIIIGAVSEELKKALAITNDQIGSLVLALFLTSMIVQLIIGPMLDKFGHKPLAILGFLVASGSMFLLAFAPSVGWAFSACILLGVGAMCLNTVGNTLIPVVMFEGRDPARASNFGNAFFGLGYVLTPLLFSLFATLALGYKTGVSIIGVLLLVFLLIALGTKFPKASTGFRFSMAVTLLGKPAVLVAALALFCYVALEISMGTWIKPYMTEIFGGDKNPAAVSNAGLVLSVFGVAMMVGRFLTSAVKNLTALGGKVIAGAALVSILAVLLMMLTHSTVLAIIAVVLTGLVFAPIFPTIVGVTFAKFEPNLYGSIFGIVFAVGLLGGTVVPKIIGNLSVGATVQQSLGIAVAMAALLFLIALFISRVGKQAR
ncbi:MAG: MFS transporter [Acidobacteria bacterium]|nr:MFS transporter [Acidobacteriota bacterium]